MKRTAVHPAQGCFGQVVVEGAEELCLPRPGEGVALRLPRLKYTWRPPGALRTHLPPGFELSLQCVIGSDGLRRFYPWDRFATFLALATTGGLAILWQRQNLSAQQLHSYRAMRLLFLRAHRMGEHFRHRFDSSQDLTVVPSGRAAPGEKDVLPEDLGQDARGQGQRWGVKELIRRGAETARAAGYPRPTIAQSIHRGLIEAARLRPLPVADERAADLVRSALFDVSWAEEPAPDLVETVTDRLLTALHRHLEEDNSAFEKWFLGPKNSLVHQLAKQKRSPGGGLEESEVRRVLLHLGWQAYQYAGNCVHAQMRTFQNALPHALGERERVWFEHMHLRQSYLGNLPLVLLAPRLGFITELLWELWEGLPDQSLVPVFHRLLDFYTTMAARRRDADRRIKRGRPARLVEATYVPPAKSQRFQDLAAEVREREGIDCRCPRREWWAELRGRPGTKVRMMHRCMYCGYHKETILTRRRLVEIGQALV